MERLFVVDTENCGNNQYEGLAKLTKKDKVVFITSKNSQGLQSRIMNEIINCKAIKESIFIEVGGKNALDFQLVAYLSMQIQKNKKCKEYYIISKDKGYDYAINFLKSQSNSCISRINNFNYKVLELDNVEKIEKSNIICLDTNLKKDAYNLPLENNSNINNTISLENFLQQEVKCYSKKTFKKIANIVSRTNNNKELDEEMFKVFNNHKIYQNCKKAINKYNALIS